MEVSVVKKVDLEILNGIKAIIGFLTEPKMEITIESLNTIVEDKESELIIARDDNNNIVGSLCLIVYTIPSTKKAFIEDVVVSEQARGLGLGKALVLKAIEVAKDCEVQYIDLSSNAKRVAANSLYRKIGFQIRDTNYYRLGLTD